MEFRPPRLRARTATLIATGVLALFCSAGTSARANGVKVGLFDTGTQHRRADGSYDPDRQALHDRIEAALLADGRSSEKPMLIFLAGAPGAGKSTIVGVLKTAGFIEPRAYLVIDPDQIKDSIPEYPLFKKIDQKASAHAVHGESTDIAREALLKAVASHKNVIVDGTLRNADTWERHIKMMRAEHPEYTIATVFVDAELDTLIQRVAEREARTGRNVEQDYLVETKALVRESIDHLEPLVDVAVEIENETVPTVKRAIRGGKSIASNLVLPLPGQMHRRQLLEEVPKAPDGRVKLALFDADQTLRVANSAGFYPKTALDVLLLPFVADKLRELNEQGYLIAIASNQGEVSKGNLNLVAADQALFFTVQLLRAKGVRVAYYDFAEGLTIDRKPSPGMARRLEEELHELEPPVAIDWSSSFVVGDAAYTATEKRPDGAPGADFSDSDRRFAEALGAKFIEPAAFFGWKQYGISVFRTKKDLVDFALSHPELRISLTTDCEALLRN